MNIEDTKRNAQATELKQPIITTEIIKGACFLDEDNDEWTKDIPRFLTKMHMREKYGMKEGESISEAINRHNAASEKEFENE